MQKLIIKTLIKLSIVFALILTLWEIEDVKNTSSIKEKNTVSAAQTKDTNRQYIPENLNYSEVIKAIKAEEGITEEADTLEKTAEKEDINEDLTLTYEDKMSPYQYMNAAKGLVKEAMQTVDETQKRHKVKKAFNFYKEYLKYKPSDIEGLLGAGTMAIYLGREEDARNILMQAYATYPKNARVHKALGDYSFKFSNFNNAIEYYNLSLLSGNLEDYATNIATAVCYEKLGDITRAIEYFKASLYLNPESEIAKQRIEMYEKMEKDGYCPDSRMYEEAFKPSEEEDIELETLMIDAQQIK